MKITLFWKIKERLKTGEGEKRTTEEDTPDKEGGREMRTG